MSWKMNAAIAASVIGLGTSVLGYVDPSTDTTPAQQQNQQSTGELSDQQDQVHEQLRRDGDSLGDATYREGIGYSYPKPPAKLPRLKFRIEP